MRARVLADRAIPAYLVGLGAAGLAAQTALVPVPLRTPVFVGALVAMAATYAAEVAAEVDPEATLPTVSTLVGLAAVAVGGYVALAVDGLSGLLFVVGALLVLRVTIRRSVASAADESAATERREGSADR
jgi:hypothetical protein